MKFNSLITIETSIREAIDSMCSSPKNKHIAGIAVVIDDKGFVIGVVTDGDIRRGMQKGITINQPVSMIVNKFPMMISNNLNQRQRREALIRTARDRQVNYLKFNHIILLDDDDKFHDLIHLSDLFDRHIEDNIVAVYGLGFVGLTLAAILANAGLQTVGVDTNLEVIRELKQGRPTFFENGLKSLLDSIAQVNPIEYISNPDDVNADIHIVCVGTPINDKMDPDFTYVIQATSAIARIIKKGDLIIFRSTLPVGTSRNLVIPLLEMHGMKVGIDFFLSFAPERTVEGNALEELQVLPQVIGGFDQKSCELTRNLFRKITNIIVEVNNLEAAEMVKLLNNTYRDLVFSFANEVSKICDGLNLNAFKLIEAANEGYPRNPIPSPSPGVGGICLAKDPYLYTKGYEANNKYQPVLGLASRSINANGHIDVLNKIKKFCEMSDKEICNITIFIVGLSFKGIPETSDIRESIAVKLIKALPNLCNIRVKDFVVSNDVIAALGCQPVLELASGFERADVVLFMNNHPLNTHFNMFEVFNTMSKPFMIFDGWNMLNQQQVESFHQAYYSTMGYISNPK